MDIRERLEVVSEKIEKYIPKDPVKEYLNSDSYIQDVMQRQNEYIEKIPTTEGMAMKPTQGNNEGDYIEAPNVTSPGEKLINVEVAEPETDKMVETAKKRVQEEPVKITKVSASHEDIFAKKNIQFKPKPDSFPMTKALGGKELNDKAKENFEKKYSGCITFKNCKITGVGALSLDRDNAEVLKTKLDFIFEEIKYFPGEKVQAQNIDGNFEGKADEVVSAKIPANASSTYNATHNA